MTDLVKLPVGVLLHQRQQQSEISVDSIQSAHQDSHNQPAHIFLHLPVQSPTVPPLSVNALEIIHKPLQQQIVNQTIVPSLKPSQQSLLKIATMPHQVKQQDVQEDCQLLQEKSEMTRKRKRKINYERNLKNGKLHLMQDGDDNDPGFELGEDETRETRKGPPPLGNEERGSEPQCQDIHEALLQRQIIPNPVDYESVMEPLHLGERVSEQIFKERVPEPLLHEQRGKKKRRNRKGKEYSKRRRRFRRYVKLDSPIANSSSEVRAGFESNSTSVFATKAIVVPEGNAIGLSDLKTNLCDAFIIPEPTQITADVISETKQEVTVKSEILEDIEGYQMDTLIPDFFVPNSLSVLKTQTCVKTEKLLTCERSSSVDNNRVKMERSLTDDEFLSFNRNEPFPVVKTEISLFDSCDDSSTEFLIKTENIETSKPHFLTDNLKVSIVNTNELIPVSSNLSTEGQEEQTSYVTDDPVIEDFYMKRCEELLEKIKNLQDSTEDVVNCVFCKTKMLRKYSFNHLLRIHNFPVDVATILLPSSFKK